MEEERIMFDKVISDVTIEEVILGFNQNMENNCDQEEDEMELF